jgi:predicted small secreted protein
MKIQVVMLTALVLSGCGTVQTVVRDDQVAVDELKKEKSYCGAVPRIYSGVTYDFCLLHAPPGEDIDTFNHRNSTPGLLIDAVVSGRSTRCCCLIPSTSSRPTAASSSIDR